MICQDFGTRNVPLRFPGLHAAWLGTLWLLVASAAAAGEIDFQRDVRPILANNCFPCHGFDSASRQSGLRLDTPSGATSEADSGQPAVVPLQPEQSELLLRVTSSDPGHRMPPPESGKNLTEKEVALLREWIADGAEYTAHWAFQPPRPAALPEVQQSEQTRNWIDHFILAPVERRGWEIASQADPETLLRRLSLDLTGLPPTLEELDDFLERSAHDGERAYAEEVERLLSSPRFGERMASHWLDLARYADTHGYFGDKPRPIWPWRDWVIQAFNANMPFDQFTVEQLAGDLLPEPTMEQRIATGFHRNAMANNETGIIDEEFRVEAVADRVETTGATWLGLTVGCAQCHDHKFDPISQREYFQLFAFFNQSVEGGLITRDDPPPTLEVPTRNQEQELEHLVAERIRAEEQFQQASQSLEEDLAAWMSDIHGSVVPLPSNPIAEYSFESDEKTEIVENRADIGDSDRHPTRESSEQPQLETHVVGTGLPRVRGIRGEAGQFDATQHIEIHTPFDPDLPWTAAIWIHPSSSLGCIWSKIQPTGDRRGIELIWQKGRLQLNLVHRWGSSELRAVTRDPLPSGRWHHLLVQYDGSRKASGLQMIINGEPMPLTMERDRLDGTLANDQPLRIGRRDSGLGFHGLLDEFCLVPEVVDTELALAWSDSQRISGILARSPDDRTSDELALLRDTFIARHGSDELRESNRRMGETRQAEQAARQAIPRTLVMQDRSEPRPTHILIRGEYDRPGDEVDADVPRFLPPWPDDLPRDRLGLARWLVSRDHPLTARVAVNRFWQLLWGEGLVRTTGDFGMQGELPTHPELLDALAVRFMESGWDVKGLIREICLSAAYRQSSRASEDRLRLDPDNRWLARGPRFRLPAELIRDQALEVSGLLSTRVGGPSVKPWQPDGLWEAVSYNAEESYVPDRGEARWRRSLYAYWKRQAPPPAMLAFDAPTREKCVVGRSRTNTPLQALVLLNDPAHVAAAGALAARMLRETRSSRSAATDGVVSRTRASRTDVSNSESEASDLLGTTPDDVDRIVDLFRRIVSRSPEPLERDVLLELLQKQRQTLAENPEEAARLWTEHGPLCGELGEEHDVPEWGAWTLVAQTMMNLDEVVTRR